MYNFKIVKAHSTHKGEKSIILFNYKNTLDNKGGVPTASQMITVTPGSSIGIISPEEEIIFSSTGIEGNGWEASYHAETNAFGLNDNRFSHPPIIHGVDDTDEYNVVDRNGYLFINHTIEDGVFYADIVIRIMGRNTKVFYNVVSTAEETTSEAGISCNGKVVGKALFKDRHGVRNLIADEMSTF